MANPNRKDTNQDWREKGWETIEGGQKNAVRNSDPARSSVPANAPVDSNLETHRDVDPGREYETSGEAGIKMTKADHPLLGDDYRDAKNTGYPAGYDDPNARIETRNVPEAYKRDDLMNTDRNPMMEVPRTPGGTLRILLVVFAVLVFGLIVWALFQGFQKPAERQPTQGSTTGARPVMAQSEQVHNTSGAVQLANMVFRAYGHTSELRRR